MANGKIETYPEAARSIHLYLKEFCDEEKPYPKMIADAAVEAANKIEELRAKLQFIRDRITDLDTQAGTIFNQVKNSLRFLP